MRKLALLLLILTARFSFAACTVSGTQLTAASVSSSDVQACFNLVSSTTTLVTIPAGSSNWTTQVTLTVPSGNAKLSIIGAGTTATGGGDQTVITDNDSTNQSLLSIALNSASTVFRMGGVTFQGGSGGIKDAGMIAIGGPGTIRLDHDHFNFQTYATAPRSFMVVFGNLITGVVDHSILDQSQTSTVLFTNGTSNTAGGTEWTQSAGFGTSNFFFIEDNIVNGNATSSSVFEGRMGDCWTGGHYVVRFNTITETSGPEQHATGHSGDDRGCRAQEVYGNLFQQGAGQPTNGVNYDMADLGSGAALVWGNSAPGVVKNVFLTDVTRKDNTTYGQSAPPAGWGYCGTAFNGTGSTWDQNSNTLNGYACLDQPGRGAGDLLSYNPLGSGSGSFPQKCNLTQNPGCTIFTGQWPRQALEPIYLWNNNASPASGWGGVFWSDSSSGPGSAVARLTSNVDYYSAASGVQTSSTSPFNGTSGTGWGTLANRPSTCTQGVGYFATDQGSWNTSASNPYGVQQSGADGLLYLCSSTNTWSLYYTPYTYPNPLQGGTTVPLTVTVTGSATDTVTDNHSILTGCNGSTSPCSANYTTGTIVILTASAGSGQSFTGWSGSGCSGTGTCTVTMSAAESVTATFSTSPSFSLSVTVAGSGSVTSSPSGINCPGTCSASYASGTVVTLTPVASTGNLFINWSTCSFSGTCAVTMSATEVETANFCQPVAPVFCNNQTAQSTSFSISGGIVTINTSNTFPSGAYIGLSQFTAGTQLNGQILLTNGATMPTKVVGTLYNTQLTALTPANVSTTADTTGFLQGQGWNPFYTAPFPAPGSPTCVNGNGSPGCTLPSPTAGFGPNPWAFDGSTPCGSYGVAPCNPMVELTDISTNASSASMVPSLGGETNEKDISLSDGSTPPNYMYCLSQEGGLHCFSGHIDPTHCNGVPCFISDVQGDTNAWTLSPVNYGAFSRLPANNPGPHKSLRYTLNLSPTCGISGSPDCSIAPVLQAYELTYSFGAPNCAAGQGCVTAVLSATHNPNYALNTCPGYGHLWVGNGLGVSSQIQIDNFDNHILVGVEGGSQGTIQHHSAFIFSLTNGTCQEMDTGGYTGTALNFMRVTASHGGTSYAVGDTGSFTEAGGVCASTYTIASISGGGSTGPATGVTIASGATSGCYLARGWSTTATSGSGTGLEVDVTAVGTPGSFITVYPPVTAAACPAGINTTLTCATPVTTTIASAGIHNCAMQTDPVSWENCSGPNSNLTVTWQPDTTNTFANTNQHLSGHGASGYDWAGNAVNPSLFEHTSPAGGLDTNCTTISVCYNLFTLPNSGCAGAPGGVQMHGNQPTINNNDLQPYYVTSSINSPGVPAQLNPPGFVCQFGQQAFFTVAKSPNPGVVPGVATTYAKWYENTNNAVAANGPVENFEGYDNIMSCAPDGLFCLVATDENGGNGTTNFPGNVGLGLDNAGAAFVGVFSVMVPQGVIPPAPPLGMFATINAQGNQKEPIYEESNNGFVAMSGR